MTLDEALIVFNNNRHNDYDQWEIKDNGENLFIWDCVDKYFTEFEAIAIANAYLYGRLLDDKAIKSVQVCLEADALALIVKSVKDSDLPFCPSREYFNQKLIEMLTFAYQSGKRVGEYPETEKYFRYNQGKASDFKIQLKG